MAVDAWRFDEWNTQLDPAARRTSSALTFCSRCSASRTAATRCRTPSEGQELRRRPGGDGPFGKVWPRHEYGEVAMHHYLVSRALLYRYVHDDESATWKS